MPNSYSGFSGCPQNYFKKNQDDKQGPQMPQLCLLSHFALKAPFPTHFFFMPLAC